MSKLSSLSILIGITLVVLVLIVRADVADLSLNLSAQNSPINSPLSPLNSPLPTPTPTLTPFVPPIDGTATPTPTRSRRVVNELIHPGHGDAVAAFVSIRGTALITAFRKYDVHIAVTGSEDWRWLTTRTEVVRDGIVYVLDTSPYEDGHYDMRVRAIDDVGNYSEAFIRGLELRNANPPTATPLVDAAGVVQPVTATPTVTPTPTAQPTHESYVPGGRGIYRPASGDVVRGYLTINGTVNGYSKRPFEQYELALSVTGQEEWNWLYTGATQYWQAALHVLDSTQFEDGLYDLRLRNVFRDGNYEEFFVRRLRFANQSAVLPLPYQENGIYTPQPGDWVGGIVDFVGTAADPAFQRWELYFSPAGAETWSFIVSSEQPVINGSLAQLDLSQLDFGYYDFRLRVVRTDLNYDDYYTRNLELEALPTAPPPTATATATPTPAG